MQKRTRRPHGLKTKKVSISVSAADLRVLSARARRVHGGNVSAVIHEMVESLRRLEAADRVLARLGADRITDKELQQAHDEITSALASRPRRRRAA